ncbi:hypothetical protein MCOR06_006769 [Pyricularia oryzae]|nr:hypothetical protein MCOR06_006769 [Pyricularia oryzae]
MATQKTLISEDDIIKLLGSIALEQPGRGHEPTVQADRQHGNASVVIQDEDGDVEMNEPGLPTRTGSQRYDPMRKYHLPHGRQTQAHDETKLPPASSRNRQNHGLERAPPSGPRNQAKVRTFATPTRPIQAWNTHHDTLPAGSSRSPAPFFSEDREKAPKPATQLCPAPLQPDQQHEQPKHQQQRPNGRKGNWRQRYQQQQQGNLPSDKPPVATVPVTTGEKTTKVINRNATAPHRAQGRADLKPRLGRRAKQTQLRAERSALESARRAAIVEKMIQDGVLRHA